MRIIVGGYIGLYPTGGATWDYIQYPLGLKMLGHDVYYIEDTGQYPIFQKEKNAWDDASYCVSYLKKIMNDFGMKDRWAYRDVASGNCYGMSVNKINELCSTADLFINISCSTYMRDEYKKIPHRILIDSDPMFTQVQYYNELNGEKKTCVKELVESHNYLFSFGENIGKKDCLVPTFNLQWLNTRQPVCLDLWKNTDGIHRHGFTSIMNWSGRKKMLYENEEWGQKDVEFEKYITLPVHLPGLEFKVVINPPLNQESNYNHDAITGQYWEVLTPATTVANCDDYMRFIKTSLAEFSVAKETYVKSRSGWFSCRSACYLAAGRPVIAQETGWSKYIPSGNGLFAFNDMDSALEAVRTVTADIKKNSRAAIAVAHEYFDSNIVLKEMISKLN